MTDSSSFAWGLNLHVWVKIFKQYMSISKPSIIIKINALMQLSRAKLSITFIYIWKDTYCWTGRAKLWQYRHLTWEIFLGLLEWEVTRSNTTVYCLAISSCLSRQNGESLAVGRTFFPRHKYEVIVGFPVIFSFMLWVRSSEVTPIDRSDYFPSLLIVAVQLH